MSIEQELNAPLRPGSTGLEQEQPGKFPFEAFEFDEASGAAPTLYLKEGWKFMESRQAGIPDLADAIASNDVDILNLQQSLSTTQRVLHGRTDSHGDPEFLSEENIGNITALATSTPLLLAFANGFDEDSIVNYRKQITADVEPDNWKNLIGLKKHYLYADRSDAGVISYNKTLVPPQYARHFHPNHRFSTHSLLHFEEETTPIDEYGAGVAPITWTVNNAVRSAAQKKWGTYSYLYNGTDSYIETTDITDLQRPFTIELWFYSTNDTTRQYILGNNGTYGILVSYRADLAGDNLYLGLSSASASYDLCNTQGTTTVAKDNWHKLTIEWDGAFYRLYLNGALEIESASTTPTKILGGIQIGNFNSNAANAFLGYIDEFRALIGNCRYGTAHDVETAAFTPDAQWFDTQNMKWYEGKPGSWTEKKRLVLGHANADRRVGALLHFNADADTTDWTKLIDEYGNKFTFVGTAKLDTDDNGGGNVAPKFGNRFLLLDGNSDYAKCDFGAGNTWWKWTTAWTVEFWFYTANNSTQNQGLFFANEGSHGIAIEYNDGADDKKVSLSLSSDGTAWDITSATKGSAQTVAAYTWYKITLEWDGTDYKLYWNGVLDQTVNSSEQVCDTYQLYIGYTSGYLNGGIDEFRPTLGHNQYGAAHTPETAELSTEGTINTCVSKMLRDSFNTNFGSPGKLIMLEECERAVGWDVAINPTQTWTSVDLSALCSPGTKTIYGFALITHTDATAILCVRCSCSNETSVARTAQFQHKSNAADTIGIPMMIRAEHGKFDIRDYSASHEIANFQFRLHGWYRR